MKKTRYYIIAIILAAFLFPNCKGKSGRKEGPTIFTKGGSVRLAKKTIDSDGRQIIVDKPGDPLDGLTIDIPENAFTEPKVFRISYEKIKSHKLGKYFNPITPLITIDNGGGYSEETMVLTIPVKVKPDEFAMAFYYNTRTGRLEGMPLLDSDEEKVVVATRRFGLEQDGRRSLGFAAQAGGSNEEQEKIIITAAKEKDIRGDHTTGFDPGEDDFSSVNYGSTVAPGGHCEGQSITAMWYYTQKTLKGQPTLNRLMDNDGGQPTPKFWQDDALGIKLASVVQEDYTVLGGIARALAQEAQLFGQVIGSDRVTMNAFRYAILLTQEPQFVGIYQKYFFKGVGHAMIVYKIKDNALYVADPNFPGDKRNKIRYEEDGKLFQPYKSGGTAASTGIDFTNIFYFAKSSVFSWPTVASHWEEWEEKTIGKDDFPEFSIVAMNADVEFEALEDGFKVPEGRLKLNVRGGRFFVTPYSKEGKPFSQDVEGGYFQLPPGKQEIKIVVTDDNNRWAGFKRVKVSAEGGGLTQPEESRPTYGQVYADIDVNGQKFPVDTTRFQLSPGSKYFSLRAYGFKVNESDADYLRNHLYIELENCTGLGYYDNATATWKEDAIDGSEYKASAGKVEITSWAPGVLNGSFSFTVTQQNTYYGEPKVKTISGTFRYKGPVYDD